MTYPPNTREWAEQRIQDLWHNPVPDLDEQEVMDMIDDLEEMIPSLPYAKDIQYAPSELEAKGQGVLI